MGGGGVAITKQYFEDTHLNSAEGGPVGEV